MGATARFRIWIVLAAIIFAGTLTWLWLLRGSRILDHDHVLIGGWIALVAMLLLVAALLETTPSDAIKLPPRVGAAIVVTVAAMFHVLALFCLLPALSEDTTRYRLDGKMWLAGVNPYYTTPLQFFATHPPDAIDAALPAPYLNTIYPPTSQAVFAAAAAIERLGAPAPELRGRWRELLPRLPRFSHALVLRAIFAGVSIAAAWLLTRILISAGQSPWWAVLAGWNPLTIVETAGMGHQDILGVLFLLMMLRMLQRRRCGWAGAMLALACGVKPLAAVLLPFLWRDAGRRGAIVFAICAVAMFLPIIVHGGWVHTGTAFAQQWEANGSVYELIKYLLGTGTWPPLETAKNVARVVAIASLLSCGGVLWWQRAHIATAGYWLMLVMLLVSPVVYPWYLLWMLCFVPLNSKDAGKRMKDEQAPTENSSFSFAGLVFSGTVSASYVLWHLPRWEVPGWVLAAEYAPVYAVLVLELVAWSLKRPRRFLNQPVESAT